ncbi:MAG: SHOCT domain-containing protein [Candidatus Atribacteria bacterium]|nr:MAG: SHOCT domain-containing protein [Candidatus Atribacteria bacterium]
MAIKIKGGDKNDGTELLVVGTRIFLRISRGDDKIKRSSKDVREEETPLEILKRRYSKGEIDAEEFARRKKDLES